jgi:predicted acylesterase/phospholipase RssA
MPDAKPFELGLVMAGAISAGAYTGGVIDFLVQALDEWYKAKSAGAKVPRHDVKLKVMSGASAGGITAAIAAGAIASRFPPVTDVANSTFSDNKLFDSWVNRIDITSLLGVTDLQNKKAPVRSLLDAGLVRVEQGRGTFVNRAAMLDYPIGPRTRFTEVVSRHNLSPDARLIRSAVVPAEGRMAEAASGRIFPLPSVRKEDLPS